MEMFALQVGFSNVYQLFQKATDDAASSISISVMIV